MKEAYLEVTYRSGRAVAAYYYLPSRGSQKVARTRLAEPGLIVDFAADGRPLGVEIKCAIEAQVGRAEPSATGIRLRAIA